MAMQKLHLAACLAVVVFADCVSARSFFWSNPVSGVFNDAANWGNDGPPATSDNGFIRAFDSPTIQVNQTTTVRQIVVGFGGDLANEPTLVLDDDIDLTTTFFLAATGGNGLPEDGAGGNGRIIHSAGTLNVGANFAGSFNIGTTAGGTAVYEMSGGELNLNGARGWVGSSADATAHFIQTGGSANFLADENAIARFVDTDATYSISGGAFRARNLDLGGWAGAGNQTGPGNGVLEVIGSDIDELAIVGPLGGRNRPEYVQRTTATYRAVLDNDGVKPLTVQGDARFEGSYDVGLLGGAVLVEESTIPLINVEQFEFGFESASLTPTAEALWDETNLEDSLNNDLSIRVTLDDSAAVGPNSPVAPGDDLLEVTGLGGRTQGFVELTGLDGPVEFNLDLSGAAPTQEVIDFLAMNPAASARESSIDGYDIALQLDPSGSAGHFVWDFTVFDGEALVDGLAISNPTIPDLPGDYDNDGMVDADDYLKWRNDFGMTGEDLDSDGNADGIVDAADYTIWRDNLETTAAVGVVSAPEPASGFLAMAVLALFVDRRRKGGQR